MKKCASVRTERSNIVEETVQILNLWKLLKFGKFLIKFGELENFKKMLGQKICLVEGKCWNFFELFEIFCTYWKIANKNIF